MSLSGGTILFTPDADFSGEAHFDYILSNGAGSDTGTVTINVAPVADGSRLPVPGIRAPEPLSGDITVNTTTVSQQLLSSVAAIDGGYVVTWSSLEANGNTWNIYAQRYATDGTALGSETLVSTSTADNQQFPAMHRYSSAAAIDGGYVITWSSINQDGSDYGIYQQRYTSGGAPLGGETRVNTTTSQHQIYSAVAAINDGYVVTWSSLNQDGSDWGIYAQRYLSNGTKDGGETLVNTTTSQSQHYSSVAAIDGGYVVTWSSNENGLDYDRCAGSQLSAGAPHHSTVCGLWCSVRRQGAEWRVNAPLTLRHATEPPIAACFSKVGAKAERKLPHLVHSSRNSWHPTLGCTFLVAV